MRLIQLLDWAKATLPKDEINDGAVILKIKDRALEEYGCSEYTATNYAKIVALRLRKEAGLAR